MHTISRKPKQPNRLLLTDRAALQGGLVEALCNQGAQGMALGERQVEPRVPVCQLAAESCSKSHADQTLTGRAAGVTGQR